MNFSLSLSLSLSQKVVRYNAYLHSPSITYCSSVNRIYERDICFADIVIRFEDFSYCDYVQARRLKSDCLKQQTSNNVKCVGNTFSEECYTKIAILKDDVDLCKSDSCYTAFANKKSDYSFCEIIKNPQDVDGCYYSVSNNEDFKDFNICEKISDLSYKNSCFNDFAGKQNSVDICKKITKNFIQNTCIKKVAVNLNDISICDNATDSDGREYCRAVINKSKNIFELYFAMERKSKLEDCELLPDESKSFCIDTILNPEKVLKDMQDTFNDRY